MNFVSRIQQENPEVWAEEAAIIDVSEAIWSAFTKSKLSRKDLAERLGVSKARVTQILSGDENLTVRTVARILHACGFELRTKIKKATV